MRAMLLMLCGLVMLGGCAVSSPSDLPPFHDAARSGDVKKVRELLAEGQDVNAKHKGYSALYLAAWQGHADVVEVLLDGGAEINDRTPEGGTALQYAAESGHEDIVRLLLERGGNPQLADRNGETPLHFAATAAIARLLVDHGADVRARTHSGVTPLHLACSGAIAELLIRHGAEVDAMATQGEVGGTPLYGAAFLDPYDRLDVARVLLANGADVNAVNPSNWDSIALHEAAFRARQEFVALLIDHGANVNFVNSWGRTPLMVALSFRRVDNATLLINRGTDVTIADKDGTTPLHMAAWVGDPRLVELIIAKGADVNARDKFGTPLGRAKSEEISRILKSHGGVK